MKLITLTTGLVVLSLAMTAAAAPAQSGAGKPQSKPQERIEKQEQINRDEAQGKATRAEEQIREREQKEKEAAAGRSQEMQERSQERKQIQEEYHSEGEKAKGKKPWRWIYPCPVRR